MVSSASIVNEMSCLSEVSSIPDGDEEVVSLENEILFSLVTFYSSNSFEVSSIETLSPNLSNLVSMVEFLFSSFFWYVISSSDK